MHETSGWRRGGRMTLSLPRRSNLTSGTSFDPKFSTVGRGRRIDPEQWLKGDPRTPDPPPKVISEKNIKRGCI